MEFKHLKSILEKHNLWAKKSLGQHFLTDESICQRMVQHLNLKDQTIVEVGPGPGSLTDILLKTNARFLMCIEKDQRFIDILKESKTPSCKSMIGAAIFDVPNDNVSDTDINPPEEDDDDDELENEEIDEEEEDVEEELWDDEDLEDEDDTTQPTD